MDSWFLLKPYLESLSLHILRLFSPFWVSLAKYILYSGFLYPLLQVKLLNRCALDHVVWWSLKSMKMSTRWPVGRVVFPFVLYNNTYVTTVLLLLACNNYILKLSFETLVCKTKLCKTSALLLWCKLFVYLSWFYNACNESNTSWIGFLRKPDRSFKLSSTHA